MKKLIAVLVALAMVLSMSVMAFAEYAGCKSPSEICNGEEEWNKAISLSDWELADYANYWKYIDIKNAIDNQGIYTDENGNYMSYSEANTAYAVYVIANVTESPADAITEVVNMVSNGDVAIGDVIQSVGNGIMGGIGGDGESGDLSGVLDQIIGSIGGGNTDPEVSTEAYVEELKVMINSGASFDEVTQKISDDLGSGYIVISQLPEIAELLMAEIDMGNIEDNETVQQIIEFIDGLGGEGGIQFPDFGDIQLPDIGGSSSGSFLDTILGIIGGIGDLFGGENSDEKDPTPNEPIPDTGDVSFVAVAAVAAVAGAAFVLTRKKEDAE